MKTCTLCNITEIESGSWCDRCRKNYLKEYRKNNKERLKQSNKNWRKDNKIHYNNHQYNNYATTKGRIQYLIKSARRRAKKKNIEFDIDIEWLTSQFENQNNRCALTNIEFYIPTERNIKNPFSPSLDRIDPTKGYVKNNVRVVCYIVNCALHNFGEEVFNYISNQYLQLNNIQRPQFKDEYKINSPKEKKDKKYRETLMGTIKLMMMCTKRKEDVQINENDLIKLFEKQNNKCALTNIEFDFKFYKNKQENPFRPSIDRIDSSEGYTKDNIRLVCVAVNFALNEFGEEIFKQICKAYLSNKGFIS